MNDRKDISDAVQALLPAELVEKVREVEQVLGKRLLFFEDASLPGRAKGSASPEGIIRLSPESVKDNSVVGEEIMHLRRWTLGYPAIEPTQRAVIHDYASALLQLTGHFDEHAFFPFLERLGLNPRAVIHAAMQPLLEALRQIPGEVLDVTKYRVGLPVVYVQAALLAPESPERDSLLRTFDDSRFSDHREIGRLLCTEIEGVQKESPAGVEQSMRRCLENHLGIDAKGAIVKTITYAIREAPQHQP